MKKVIFIIVFSLLLMGCEALGYVANTRSNKPVKSDFSYYQENFKLNREQSKLRTDGVYLRVEYAVVDRYPTKDTLNWVYRFFEAGQVYINRYVRKKYEHDNLENVARAYYKLNGNNISIESFTTGRKEYWYWSGTIKGDTLHITSVKGEGNKKRGYKALKEKNEIYIFKEMAELKNSIEPNW
jgi:hypothetical protein